MDTLSVQDYVIIDEFLPSSLYTTLRTSLLQKLNEDEFNKAGIGDVKHREIREGIRGDYVYWLDEHSDEHLALLFTILHEMIVMFNRYCYLSLSGFEFHLAHYPKGSFYKKHLDQFKERNNRLISVIIYLNEGWRIGDGGELKMYLPNGKKCIEPLQNRCLIFRSDTVPHEVLTTQVSRYSLTGWLLHQPSSVGYILG